MTQAPTRHGDWRVIDGKLVDMSDHATSVDAPVIAIECAENSDTPPTGEPEPRKPKSKRNSSDGTA